MIVSHTARWTLSTHKDEVVKLTQGDKIDQIDLASLCKVKQTKSIKSLYVR